MLQRKCACGNHTVAGGECVACAKNKSGFQRKLAIGASNDPLEQEADRVADQVLTTPIHPHVSKERPQIQRYSAQATGDAGTAPASVGRVLTSSGRPLDPQLQQDMEQRFGHDFSQVRVHSGTAAEQSVQDVNANAYTVGHNIVFGTGQFAPGTHEGRRLIAHELAHVVQQSGADGISAGQNGRKLGLSRIVSTTQFRSEAAEGMIQRRRVPASAGLNAALPAAGAGLTSARTGLARILSRAWAGLTAAQQATVRTAATAFGITWTTEANLLTRLGTATRGQLVSFANAIRTEAPSAELGNPLLIDTGARPGTADAVNLTTLVTNANSVFTTIASGARDADITQVFGAAKVATAKTKYDNARTRMNALRAVDKIVTDRSGYGAEVGLGGLSNSSQISVEPSTIDNPTDDESIITLIHESMHAGNSDVRDFGYIDQPSFTALAESVKLTNAAHFEVVPRRIRGASHAFTGVTFIPAGTTVGGVAAPTLTPREQAIRGASEKFRAAWAAGLNLHSLFVRVFRTPSEWNTLDLSTQFSGTAPGAHFAGALPFWSKVEMLTIHTRAASINPAGVPAAKPVTLIDIALSEGLIRKLSQGMNSVPQTPTAALAFETANATTAERTAAAASANAERDLLIRLVIRLTLGSITGAISRDQRVVARMAQAGSVPDFSDILAVRPPSAFP